MARMTDALLAEIDQEGKTTKRVLERLPDEKLTWKPHPKSMTLGQLAMHVATLPGGIARALTKDVMDLLAVGADSAQAQPNSSAELMAALEEGLKAAKQVIAGFDDQMMMGTWKITRGEQELMAAPRAMAARFIMLNHWYHHRGQLSVYMRLLDIPVPSIYGPSADENPWGSQ